MLQIRLKPPSNGALRLLRWLALYGSFGTAAGATAFVLEEQRRQICRLSRIRDNGKKLREFMHRRNPTPTSLETTTAHTSLPNFHDYVHHLEKQGVVKREPVIVGGGQEEYHYEIRARDFTTASKSRPRGGCGRKKGCPKPNCFVAGSRRDLSTSIPRSRQRLRNDVRRLASFPQPTTLGYLKAQTTKKSSSQSPGLTKAQQREEKAKSRKAFEAMITAHNEGLKKKEFDEFLVAAARSGDLWTIGTLWDAHRAHLPWSEYLYPSFLQALDLVAVSVKPVPGNIWSLFQLGRRVLAHSPFSLTRRMQIFHEAGAFPLVMAAFKRLQAREWSPGFARIILDSALRVAALAAGRTDHGRAELLRVVGDTLQEIPKDTHFFQTFPDLYHQVSTSPGCRGSFSLIVLESIGHMCSQNSVAMLPILEMVLKRLVWGATSAANFADVVVKIVDGKEPCSEQCYSLLIHHFRALFRNRESVLEEKLLELGLQKTFLNTIDTFSKIYSVQRSPAVIQARLLLDGDGRMGFNAEEMDTMVFTLGGRKTQVAQLFRRYFHLEMTTFALQRCWTAIIQTSAEDDIMEFLDSVQEQSNSFSHFHLERLRAALLRQTWWCLHNFDRVQGFFEHINKFRTAESKRGEVGILSNTMIAICAKAGRWEEVKHYVWDARYLNAKARMNLNDAGFRFETVLLARKGQWATVNRNLQRAREKRSEAMRDELLLDLLGILSQQKQAQDVLDFFKWAVIEAGAKPTQQMFDMVISRCLADGNQQLMSKTLAFMKEVDFQWRIQAETVAMSFRNYASKYKPRSVQFMQCLRGLKKNPRLLSKDVCLVLMERCSVAARRLRFVGRERLNLMQQRSQIKLVEQVTELEALASTAPWISQEKDARSQASGNPLLERAQAFYIKMQVESSLQHWQEVVALFEDSLHQNIPRLELSLCLAVTACLNLNDPASGADLIRTGQAVGFDTTKAEVVLTSQSGPGLEVCDPSELRKGVLQHYAYLQSRFLPIDHGKLVQAAHAMVLKSQAAASVALLSEVYQSFIAKMQPFDIVVMTCFLAAYSRIFDVNGVRWTVRTILSNKLLLDIHFFRSLAQARIRICAFLKRDGQRRRSREVYQLFQIWDMVCWRRYEKQQQNVVITGRVMANMLVRLHVRGSPWDRFLTNRVRVRKLYNRETARANVKARLQRRRSVDGEVEARGASRAGLEKGLLGKDKPPRQSVYANRVDSDSSQNHAVVPPSTEDVATS